MLAMNMPSSWTPMPVRISGEQMRSSFHVVCMALSVVPCGTATAQYQGGFPPPFVRELPSRPSGEGFTWSGAERVSKMAEWPDWHPPAEMIERQPYLPRFMSGGEGNPLGARALFGQDVISHPWHQSALDHRHVRVLRLHPPDQR